LVVLDSLRSNKKFHNLKVVAYTAYASNEDVERLISIGFDAVLIKPLTSLKLLNVLKSS